MDIPVMTTGLPPELRRVPLPRKLPVAHQVLLRGLRARIAWVLRLSSAAHATCPPTVRALCSL
jgi:hypothetical protein